MINVKSLVTRANPVPEADGLSARAREELAALTGTGPAAGRPAPVRRRPRPLSRRGALVGALACVAAVVVAGAAFFALDGPQGPGGGGQVADEPYFATAAELEGATDLIVRARLGEGHEETVDGIRETVATARVTATAKGSAPAGGTVEVAYTTPGFAAETADLVEGHEYVMLLGATDGGRFTLVNTVQGAYRVEGGRPVPSDANEVALSPEVVTSLGLAP